MKTYVLDACALIAFFNDEKGADKIEKFLRSQDDIRLISVINAFEVCYDSARTAGFDEGILIFEEIEQLPVDVILRVAHDKSQS